MHSSQVAPQVGGRLSKLLVEEGKVLKKGDIAAQIDEADYILRREESRAALAQAKAQLDLMLAGAREEDIARGKEQVREARAAATAAQSDKDRIQKVFELKSATQKQWDDAQSAAERTSANLAAAEQNLAKLLSGNRKEEITIAQTAVESAKARLAVLEKSLADCVVTAPMDGVVTAKSHEEGEIINPGSTLFTLSRLDEVWLSIYVPEGRLSQVKLGQQARVKVDGNQQEFTGIVTFVSPEAEFTPKNVQTPAERAKLVYRVKITLKNPNGTFKPGMPADGFLL